MTEAVKMPRHVAIVMDGNGRWAKKRFMPRLFGHKAGVDALVNVIRAAADRGIEHLTVFAFSSENWRRDEEEVSGLMELAMVAMTRYLRKLHDDGVRIRIIGDRERVSERLRKGWDEAEALTAGNSRITLNVAFNYGGRWDMVQACRKAVASGLAADQISEATLAPFLALAHAPELDLFIRTGGEYRISNFLLWDSAYAEFFFTDCLWPDFDGAVLDQAIAAFGSRERRYGGMPKAKA